MTLEVKNAIDLTYVLKKWIEEDAFYDISSKFNEETMFVIIHEPSGCTIQINVLENPLGICIGQESGFMEGQPQLLEKMKGFEFVSLSNLNTNLYQFDVYPRYRYNELNELSSVVLQRQIYPDDLTRNKFFDHLSQMVRAHMTLREIISIMEFEFKENLK